MVLKAISEGMVFAVPLGYEKFALGLMSRHARNGVSMGFFFGQAYDSLPTEVPLLQRDNAILVARFGDGGLTSGEWPTIGLLVGWDRGEWSCRYFLREEPSGMGILVEYDDKNPSKVVAERLVSEVDKAALPLDGAVGYRLLARRLIGMFKERGML